jgi:hypothetical protein
MALTKKALASLVEGLSCEHMDAIPVNKDWTEEAALALDGLPQNMDGYTYAEHETCPECDKTLVLVNQFSECRHSEIDEECGCEGYIHSEGPMMNYFYPCDFKGSIEEAALALDGLPLCAIELSDGTKGLALTGGGMDLSWEICEAYIALGFLPPVHFCGNLPRMSGKTLKDDGTRMVIAAAKRSAEVTWQRAGRDCERIAELEKSIRGEDIARTRRK